MNCVFDPQMNQQSSLWQNEQQSFEYSELCNALYERELKQLADSNKLAVESFQARLKSLPYYIKRTALMMTRVETPLDLDCQNATWSSKQSTKSLTIQPEDEALSWFEKNEPVLGLVLPVGLEDRIVLDSVDRVDIEGRRFRTNHFGWFAKDALFEATEYQLLKPTKRVMSAACSGHRWRDNKKITPAIPSLRELLLSCQINWKNFKLPNTIS